MYHLIGDLARIHQDQLLAEAEHERLLQSLRPDPRTAPATAGLVARLMSAVRRTPRAAAQAKTNGVA